MLIHTIIRPFALGLLALSLLTVLSACTENNAEQQVAATQVESDAVVLKVYKSPTCGCCGKWVDHMETAGFLTDIHDQQDLNPIKAQLGVAPKYRSCHTAVTEGYVFEGHIPSKVVQRFLAEKPENALGLSVPQMPIGSPGMEMGQQHDPYDVLLLMKDGSAIVYQTINAPADI